MALPELTGKVERPNVIDVEQMRIEIERLTSLNHRLDEALRLERNKTAAIEAGSRELRQILLPLFNAMKRIYGELDLMGIADALDPTPGASSGNRNEFWERTKARVGGKMADIIDVLMGHPGMTTTAVAKAAGCRVTTASTLLSRLKGQNLTMKKGSLWVLNSQ